MIPALQQAHGAALSLAAFASVVTGGIILARNANSPTARLHLIYSVAVAWWFVCMAMAIL